MKKDYESFWDNFIDDPASFMQSPIEPFNNPIRVRIAQEAEIGDTVLDVGSATCISYPLFKDKKQYVGMDFTKKFLKTAKNQHPELTVVHGDSRQLPFANETFDTVYIKDVLIHLGPEDYKKVITEMWRVTKKQILITCGSPLTNTKTTYTLYVQFPGYPEKGVFYGSNYNEQEMISYISQLTNFESYKIIEGIQQENDTTYQRHLIIAKKHQQ